MTRIRGNARCSTTTCGDRYLLANKLIVHGTSGITRKNSSIKIQTIRLKLTSLSTTDDWNAAVAKSGHPLPCNSVPSVDERFYSILPSVLFARSVVNTASVCGSQ